MMKKVMLSLLLGVMIFTSVFFMLGCPKPKDPGDAMSTLPETGAAGDGDTGGAAGGGEAATDEGG